jgi:L-rhamnose isomerase
MSEHGERIEQTYALAKERYAAMGVNADQALQQLAKVPISLHCWQGDDNTGFENLNVEMGGGLAITGNYPGKARTPDELRADYDLALSLVPGTHRVNLHSMYAETGGRKVDRNQFRPEHYSAWIDWAKAKGLGIDFNPTCYGHPKAADGLTLAHPDDGIRRFWIEHCMACRKVGEAIGRALGKPCVTNVWIPDGYKDVTFDRKAPRARLARSLDEVFAEPIDTAYNLDAVEPKLFGIGSETYVVGSFEFYLGYAITRKKLLCLDMGHFHPTESVADKVSSVMLYVDRVLFHVSRGIRWDSDHVVILNDELRAVAEELVRGDYLGRVHIGLDYFDASINRVAAWVIGIRAMLKALLLAMVEPAGKLRDFEDRGDFTSRLALIEEAKTLPLGAVWDYYCLQHGVPVGMAWMDRVKDYERRVTGKRG